MDRTAPSLATASPLRSMTGQSRRRRRPTRRGRHGIVWALIGPEVYQLLVGDRSWTPGHCPTLFENVWQPGQAAAFRLMGLRPRLCSALSARSCRARALTRKSPRHWMEERMGALLSTRLRRWLLLTVGVPVLAWTLERVGEELEARKGESTVSRGLQHAGSWMHQGSWRGRHETAR